MEINEVIKSLRYCSVAGSSCRGCPRYNQDSGCLDRLHAEAATALESQQKRIEELEAENRWIPVTERLPQPGQTVLVFARYPFDEEGRMEVVLYNPEMYEPFWGCVTHWMLLPEPPREVK